MTQDQSALAPPEGFSRHFRRSPLTDPWEPLYSRNTGDAIFFGLHVAAPHTHSRGFAPGGLISALAHHAMALSCGLKLATALGLVTVGHDRLSEYGADRAVARNTARSRQDRGGALFRSMPGDGGRQTLRAGNATFSIVKR